jgi:hypothetical protein
VTAAGQDGERLVTDERFARFTEAIPYWTSPMADAIESLARDIAADVERRTLDRCADELRAALNPWPEQPIATLTALADSWAAPADDERQRDGR